MQFLCDQVHLMSDKALTCLTKLGDHLCLPAIVTAAAEAIVKLPWEDNMHRLTDVIQMPVYQHHQQKLIELLHLPQRGAYSELQVLQLLEHLSYSEADIAAVVQVDIMQPAELHALMGILVNADHGKPSMLLHKTVQQRLKCDTGRNYYSPEEEANLALSAKHANSQTRCIPIIRFSESNGGYQPSDPIYHAWTGSDCFPIELPHSLLRVWVDSFSTSVEWSNGLAGIHIGYCKRAVAQYCCKP